MIYNKEIAGLVEQAGNRVSSAVKNASQATGVDFAYLMQQAKAESSFQSNAKASTSSATGLYQFIERTWMDMVNKYGAKYGIEANLSKEEVLDLRKDPEKASLMAAEFAAENKRYLEGEGIKDVGSTELYFAHFLGASGASSFLKSWQDVPNARASDLFPAAAKANKNVFYNADGSSKALDEVYAHFDRKFSIEDIGIDSEFVSGAKKGIASIIGAGHPNYPVALMKDDAVADFLSRDDFIENAPRLGEGWQAMWAEVLGVQDKMFRSLELLLMAQEHDLR